VPALASISRVPLKGAWIRSKASILQFPPIKDDLFVVYDNIECDPQRRDIFTLRRFDFVDLFNRNLTQRL